MFTVVAKETQGPEMFTRGGLDQLWDSQVSYKLILGLGIVQTYDCNLITTEHQVQSLSVQGL